MLIKDIYKKIDFRQIINSRGDPTIEIDIHTTIGVFRASCPSGASTGSKEVIFLTDNDPSCYSGKSVSGVISKIRKILNIHIENLLELEITDQEKIDKFLVSLDGTVNLKNLGVNSILPLSLGFCRIGAAHLKTSLSSYISQSSEESVKLPVPFFNVLNGGMHSGNNFAFQEIMVGFFHTSFAQNLEHAISFYKQLKIEIGNKYGKIYTSVGDEGGFAPSFSSIYEALELITETHKKVGGPMRIAIDAAASVFYKNGKYALGEKQEDILGSAEFIEFYCKLVQDYPLIYILEDPFAEDDHDSWKKLVEKLRNTDIIIVGDDLTVTQQKEVKYCGENNICTGLLVKINQTGTLTNAISAVKEARKYGMKIMISHRSGETEDTFIADFSVGIGADFIKSGAPCRGERISKYNQLLRIEECSNDSDELERISQI